MSQGPEELDPISAQLRHEAQRLRRVTTKLVAVPIAVGLVVVAGSYWVIERAKSELAVVQESLDAASASKAELDEQIATLEVHKAELADEIEAREALFERYEASLPEEAALLDEGLAAAKSGDYERALANYGRVLALNPGNELAWTLQGTVQGRTGRPAQALESLERAVALDRDDAEAWYQLSFALWDTGAKDRALVAVERSFTLEPANIERAHRNPAYRPLWDYRETQVGNRSASSEDERQLIEVAIVAAKSGRFDEAIEGYQAALAVNPSNPVVLNYLGYTFYRVGRYGEAVEALRQSIALDPTRGETHYNLGLALWRLGDREAAAAAVDEAFRLAPDYEKRADPDPNYRELRDYRAARNSN